MCCQHESWYDCFGSFTFLWQYHPLPLTISSHSWTRPSSIEAFASAASCATCASCPLLRAVSQASWSSRFTPWKGAGESHQSSARTFAGVVYKYSLPLCSAYMQAEICRTFVASEANEYQRRQQSVESHVMDPGCFCSIISKIS